MNELKAAYDTTSPTYEEFGSLKLGFNELSDRSEEEWKQMTKGAIIKRDSNFIPGRVPMVMATKEAYIDADSNIFKNYKSGVIRSCGQNPQLKVTILDFQNDYYVVQNTWGPNWGEDGKAKIDAKCI